MNTIELEINEMQREGADSYDILVFVRGLIEQTKENDQDTLNFLYDKANELEIEVFGGTLY